MVQELSPKQAKILYPDSDGQPMADNTLQFQWIVTIKENLEIIFAEQPDVFVAGDLLWYPVEGDNKTRRAPDTMVVFGRPKGDRGSYKQWEEENIAPQVVFEILSPGNTIREMAQKQEFYQTYGVEEYYLYDPYTMDLGGWQRVDGWLTSIDEVNQWVSPRLGIRFESVLGEKLKIFRPDGSPFLTSIELDNARKQAELAKQQAELDKQQAESERDLERERADKLAAKLRELGMNPGDIG
jgi:Uma2 family endonuclease